ncbi:ferritin-like domain-containing protein [Clostridium botulinum C]|uniref:Ferritin-like domain-containing protein n=2 Tax=Clostridium botulinum TaxID=1491 RepID=A0A9Q4TLD5_CLOBO|nr:ferritin-like domain-containing protein [Clostridium botulinum]MCD3194027.1 ferritin-like domain-containing protein [Clostridium botulinum C]MCD3199344.1 ferritin-like domain-containing protein [Clostridium botulinum C]MCD3204819.1 ferritin-like domain-containing protein [Clostridium botulinum C]MCD3207644.1 ferritin-like domain-containing protein [Clostridium botulinum C]MCD3224898.1 ferritin-like domain-containing protein [Clostridium botulinum C]
MAYIRNYMDPYNNYMNNDEYDSQKILPLIKSSVEGEKEDEMFYDYLIKLAPTQEQKDIIISIRDDERKHNKTYRNIYKDLTGQEVVIKDEENFKKPESYISGIEQALFRELHAVEKYRTILRMFPPYSVYRDIVFEIITDEIKHAIKYNYILYLNCCNNKKLNLKNIKKDKKINKEKNEKIKKRINEFGENITLASSTMVNKAKQKIKDEKLVENILVPGLVLGIRTSYMGINKEEQNKIKVDMKQDLLIRYIGELVGGVLDKVREKVDLDKFMGEYILPQLMKED